MRPNSAHGLGQARGTGTGLQRTQDGGGGDFPEFQGTGEAQEVIPVRNNPVQIDPVAGGVVEHSIIGCGIHAPKAGAADVRQTRTEPVTQKPEQSEHHIRICSGVGHNPRGLEFRLLLQHGGQQDQTVTQSSRHRDGVQAGELIRHQIVVSHSPPLAEIFGIGSGMHGSDGHGETHSVSGGNLPATPDFGQLQTVLGGHQPGVGSCQSSSRR